MNVCIKKLLCLQPMPKHVGGSGKTKAKLAQGSVHYDYVK
jgi:hypothetical protein